MIDAWPRRNVRIATPKEFGGLGLSVSAYARVFGAIASVARPSAYSWGTLRLCTKAIVLFGNHEQKSRTFPRWPWRNSCAYALTEPETGSDAQHIVSRAERFPTARVDLNGRKHWIGTVIAPRHCHVCAEPFERDGKMVQRPTALSFVRHAGSVSCALCEDGYSWIDAGRTGLRKHVCADDCVLGKCKGFRWRCLNA